MKQNVVVDANEATANAAYRTNEVIAIYPITLVGMVNYQMKAAVNKPTVNPSRWL